MTDESEPANGVGPDQVSLKEDDEPMDGDVEDRKEDVEVPPMPEVTGPMDPPAESHPEVKEETKPVEQEPVERAPPSHHNDDKERHEKRRRRDHDDRDKERDRERGDRDRDRGERRRDRDRGRDRSDRDRDRDREKDRTDRDRDRDREHGRDRDRDRHRRSHRSRSRSGNRRRSRSRRRSRTPPRRRRKTLFDVPPPPGSQPATENAGQPAGAPLPTQAGVLGALALPAMEGVPAAAPVPGGLPASAFNPMAAGHPPALSNISSTKTLPFLLRTINSSVPTDPGFFGGGVLPNAALIQPPSQQATRHARRVYVGGLPPTANEQSIATFFSHALAAVGGTSSGPGVVGNAVVNVYINREKNFAFVEFRTVEETSNAMALDGIMFEGVSVRVRRPNDYNPAAAAALGPSVPNPNLNLAAIGLQPGGACITDAHERVFVGGLPYYLTEEQCRELLGTFGPIKSFDLVKDRETGNSKGYGFVVYADPSVTDIACQGLNGLKMGDRVLTVRRATEGQPRPDAAAVPTANSITSLSGATRVVSLAEAVSMDELLNDQDYEEITEDMQEECSKYGVVNKIVIPRPPMPGQMPPSGLGKVVIEFVDVNAAVKARNAMHGRRFGGRTVVAAFLPEEKFAVGIFE